MNGQQLNAWRKLQGMSLREVSARLDGAVNYSTLSRWESAKEEAIPDWVTRLLLGSTPVTLPLEDLHHLLDASRAEGIGFDELLTRCIRRYLGTETETPANVTPLPDPTPAPAPLAQVAESPTSYHPNPKPTE